MRVLLINTTERTGGAAIAAHRLMEALINNGIKAKMLVRDKQSDQPVVVPLEAATWRLKWKFVWERFVIWAANKFRRHRLFEVDIANVGTDITRLPEFKQADVIHLHWVNQGFLSLENLRRITASGKPVVWTMHDMWPFTGICHYSGTCDRYKTHCHHCPVLYGGGGDDDLSARVFARKQKWMHESDITFVACSNWLAGLAHESSLLKNKRVVSIPNAINVNLYHPSDKGEARRRCGLPEDKLLILFTAFRTTNPIKGLRYLQEACVLLAAKHPELKDRLGVVAVGKAGDELAGTFPFSYYPMNYITDEHKLVNLYNAADLFVIPSLQDNLPNTVVEAMACGIPCVGFNVGGLPQMIDHLHNGYIANYCDAADLANGIHWALTDGNYAELSEMATRKAVTAYSERSIARQYIDIYNKITHSDNG